jgi:hypothetical protein
MAKVEGIDQLESRRLRAMETGHNIMANIAENLYVRSSPMLNSKTAAKSST